jgi:hypothetical protein
MSTPHTLLLPMRTQRGLNNREHPMSRHRRVKKERADVAWFLVRYAREHGKPAIPCSVLLTRISPGNGVDDDNLVGSLKSVRDEVARWLGVDDRDRMTVRYRYAQRRGPWGVQIEFGEPVVGAQYVLEAME